MTPGRPAFEPDELARRADRHDALAAVAHRLAQLDATVGDDVDAGASIALQEHALAALEHGGLRRRDARSVPRPRLPAAQRGRAIRAVLARGHGGRAAIRSAMHRLHDSDPEGSP